MARRLALALVLVVSAAPAAGTAAGDAGPDDRGDQPVRILVTGTAPGEPFGETFGLAPWVSAHRDEAQLDVLGLHPAGDATELATTIARLRPDVVALDAATGSRPDVAAAIRAGGARTVVVDLLTEPEAPAELGARLVRIGRDRPATPPAPGGPPITDFLPTHLPHVEDIAIDEPGPLGPILVFGDSVLWTSALGGRDSPIVRELRTAGWGPIRVRAAPGGSMGALGCVDAADHISLDAFIAEIRAAGAGRTPRHVLVNLGANDSAAGWCDGDTERAEAAIRRVLDELGPDVRVAWPLTARFFTHRAEQDAFNDALTRVAATDPRLVEPWDWPGALRAGLVIAPDGTHAGSANESANRARLLVAHATASLVR